MRAMDPGTVAGDIDWVFRIFGLLITLSGIFILSTLIGILGSGIESKLDELRKGKSRVLESNHTLILGWSSKIFTIISELIIAGENQKKPRIVILSEVDKVEMEDAIRDKIPNMGNMKVVCRNGIPNDLDNLAMVNPHEAKSIIILSPEEGNADSQAIKTILAITNNPKRKEGAYHIVSEIKDIKNYEVAKMVGEDEVEIILTDDVFARIMVQTSRQSGLSLVYQELMDYDGDEMYFGHEEKLIGKTFQEAIFAYETSSVMGLQYASGEVVINPPMDYVIKEGDQVITITEDDDTMIVSNKTEYNINFDAIQSKEEEEAGPERTLMLGWNLRGPILIRELDEYVAEGSFIKIVSNHEFEAEEFEFIKKSLKNTNIEFKIGDITSREIIDALDVTSYANVQVLCDENLEIQEADSLTLITLLHLRRISSEKDIDMKIVSEMLDYRNRDLAAVTKVDDFIVSDKLISLMMTQVSENKHLMRAFEDLLQSEGSEIYLKSAENYVKLNTKVNFYTLLESAKRMSQVAIGYKIAADAHDADKGFGVIVNPDKNEIVEFTKDDMLIVLAED
jgi:voltage-gated potassium channel Kch